MNPHTDRMETTGGAAKAKALSVDLFLQRLCDSGLMSVDEVKKFIRRLPKTRPIKTAEALARELVQGGKLTQFQAQSIYLDKARWMVLGGYVILDQIGKGGMGWVYRARQKSTDRVVAVKILPPSATKSPESIERFQREGRAAARLSHPNIVTLFDASQINNIYFLVMEFVDGQDLSRLVKEMGPLNVATAVNYVVQAAEGLEYAHQQHVYHRDIKPSNLLVNKDRKVKILDLGLAMIAESEESVQPSVKESTSRHVQVVGTLDYVAPEQTYGNRLADARSDIYSLGCTLYSLLTGRTPFAGDTPTQKLLAHRDQPIPSLRADRPEVPEWLDAVFQRLLAKQPEDRLQNMSEVIKQLQQEPLGAIGKNTATLSAAYMATLPPVASPQLPPDFLSSITQESSSHWPSPPPFLELPGPMSPAASLPSVARWRVRRNWLADWGIPILLVGLVFGLGAIYFFHLVDFSKLNLLFHQQSSTQQGSSEKKAD